MPLINLMLFFFQPSGLVASAVISKTHITDLGTTTDFKLFYVAMALYLYIISTLAILTLHSSTLKKVLALTFIVDHVLMVMLAANVTYTGLHLLAFSTDYSSDDDTFIL